MASSFSHEIEMQIISIGKMFPVDPKGEGFIVMFRGAAFDCVGFLGNLSDAETESFRTGDLRYGLFVYHDVPVFLVDIDTFGNTDLTLNLAIESCETRRDFFDHEANLINLFLCDYPAGIVKAMRTMGIDYATMGCIKDVCRRQKDGERIKGQIDEVYRRFTTKQMINQVDMIRLADLVEK